MLVWLVRTFGVAGQSVAVVVVSRGAGMRLPVAAGCLGDVGSQPLSLSHPDYHQPTTPHAETSTKSIGSHFPLPIPLHYPHCYRSHPDYSASCTRCRRPIHIALLIPPRLLGSHTHPFRLPWRLTLNSRLSRLPFRPWPSAISL